VRPLLIVNPAASGGRTRQVWGDLLRPIEHALGPCEVVFTERSGHATELACDAASSFDRVIAVGGDGTCSEVAAGLLESGSAAAMGLIHQGTGGDFRRSLGLENRLDQYLSVIARHEPRSIDAGQIEFTGRDGQRQRRRFINVASVGMGGLVDKYVGEGSRMLGGKVTYLVASLKALANGAVGRLRVEATLAGETRSVRIQTRILAICNGRFFGGGMEIAPRASLDDGAFDVVAMEGTDRLPLLGSMAAVYQGKHLSRPGVVHFRASALALSLDNGEDTERFLVDVDGEYVGRMPITVSVLPKALRVLA
jgi:diacylglycerol kinase (ATP)